VALEQSFDNPEFRQTAAAKATIPTVSSATLTLPDYGRFARQPPDKVVDSRESPNHVAEADSSLPISTTRLLDERSERLSVI